MRNDNAHFDPGRTASRFRTTSWTLIHQARQSTKAKEQLLHVYWSPIYAFFRRSGKSRHDAEDLTQSFFAEQTKRLIDRADAERGSFRSYLKRSLRNFGIDKHRSEEGRDGQRARILPVDPDAFERVEPQEHDDPDIAFDKQYAAVVLSEAMRRTKEECSNEGQPHYWTAYEQVRVIPIMTNNAAPPLDSVAEQLGIESAQDVSSILHTVKRRVRRHFEAVVAESVDDDESCGKELVKLRRLLNA